jgi:tRNA (guanine37-N1)-methyltransferase
MNFELKGNQVQKEFIKLEKVNVQNFINLIKKEFALKDIIDFRYKFIKENNFVLIPINKGYSMDIKQFLDANNIVEYKILFRNAIPEFKFKTIEDILKTRLPKSLIKFIPKSFDMIGSIAIVEFPGLDNLSQEEGTSLKTAVGKAITIVNSSIKSVYEQASQVKGEYRLRKLQFLNGVDDPETIHKENHAIFKINVKKTYFTPRLVTERNRISSLEINKNETIVDMFAGVGPFSIQIAKKKDVIIHSFDINLDAINYLKTNIKLNHVEDKVFPYNTDVKKLLIPDNKYGTLLKDQIDRVIMNLPERSLEFLDVACYLIKREGGIIHNYQFCMKPNPIRRGINQFKEKLRQYNYQIERILYAKKVKSYSPSSDLISLDVKVIPKR